MKKRGWKQISSGRVYELYLEVIDCAKEINIWSENQSIPPLFTRKSTNSLGSCFSERNADNTIDVAIVLNEMLLDFSDDQIRKIIVHEVAHAIRPFEGHSVSWKKAACKIGCKWGYDDIERLCNDGELNDAIHKMREAKKQYKYELYCPVCGQTWKYQQKSNAVKNPQRYRCPKDKSPLKSREIT